MFQLSDVYVMPSVSEPFGISPLEAMRSNVPVIISKQSGVAEVLDYAVKVDYWDVDALADAIFALIEYPALGKMFASKGLEEVTNLKWNDAAAKIKTVYETQQGIFLDNGTITENVPVEDYVLFDVMQEAYDAYSAAK